MGGHSNDSAVVLINTQGETQPKQEKKGGEQKILLYRSCCLWNILQHLWSLAVCSWGQNQFVSDAAQSL